MKKTSKVLANIHGSCFFGDAFGRLCQGNGL